MNFFKSLIFLFFISCNNICFSSDECFVPDKNGFLTITFDDLDLSGNEFEKTIDYIFHARLISNSDIRFLVVDTYSDDLDLLKIIKKWKMGENNNGRYILVLFVMNSKNIFTYSSGNIEGFDESKLFYFARYMKYEGFLREPTNKSIRNQVFRAFAEKIDDDLILYYEKQNLIFTIRNILFIIFIVILILKFIFYKRNLY